MDKLLVLFPYFEPVGIHCTFKSQIDTYSAFRSTQSQTIPAAKYTTVNTKYR